MTAHVSEHYRRSARINTDPDPIDAEGTADINQTPAMMIQRVEVLTGGAPATYGSDAVAMVCDNNPYAAVW